jgi:hypothetical protein
VKQTYKKTNPTYLATCEFRDKIKISGAEIESNPSKIFVFIKELVDELKPYKIKKKDNKRKHAEETKSEPVAKKSRTLLFASVELNAYEKFSNRYRDQSTDEDSRGSGEGGSVVTTEADVHSAGLRLEPGLTNGLEKFSSPGINSKKLNHSSPSNCSIHVDDNIDNLDSVQDHTKQNKLGGRLRLRRINLQEVVDRRDDSETVRPSRTDFVTSDASEDETWTPAENGHHSSASSTSAKPSKSSKTDEVFLINGTSPAAENISESESDTNAKKVNKRGSERQIKRLEKLLYNMDKEIKRLGEKEIGLDDLDDDDSYYLRCERLKARFNKVFNKLCQLKEREKLTGRVIEKKFPYEGELIALVAPNLSRLACVQGLKCKKREHHIDK